MDEREGLVSGLRMKNANFKFAGLIIVPCLIGIIIGFLIGYLSVKNVDNNSKNELLNYYESLITEIDDSFTDKIVKEVNSDNIRNSLKHMTSSMHLAGTDGGYNSAKFVYDYWNEQKLDYVKMIDYDVLLSYPDPDLPNTLELIDSNGTVEEIFNITEEIYDRDLNYSGAPFPFLAYGPNGHVLSDEVYYVNYGSEEDYATLEKLNINVSGKIVICKYGATFRGDKIFAAQNHGAIGIILYDDPKRCAPAEAIDSIYPNGEFMPESGVQRGSIFTGAGDPLTPLYPSTKNAFREKESSNLQLPNIVAQVIGYKDALWIFELMEGNKEVINDDWIGAMNVTYTYGGKLQMNKSIGINVKNTRKTAKIHNVIGVIEGTTEPDRFVLMGNHRDAWVLGSIDPTSGTATMLEISRTLSSLKQNKQWKPKRSVVFLSWDAEEYGLIGSTEWAEEFNKKLTANAVAYLNIDSSVVGSYSFFAHASPLLFDLLYNVTKKIKINDKETVYDRWLVYSPNKEKTHPQISSSLGSGSDYMAFQQRIGIPCLDARFYHDQSSKYEELGSSYALYHTSYETFKLVDSFIDPGFKSFKLMATIVSELTRTVAESLILPFNCTRYATEMRRMVKDFESTYGALLNAQNISLNGLKETIENYSVISKSFHNRLDKIDRRHIHVISQYNEQLRNFERSFLDPRGIKRKGYLHMLSAPGTFNQYASDDFPGLTDAIRNAVSNPNDKNNWDAVKLELSVVIYVIQSASSVLDLTTSFER